MSSMNTSQLIASLHDLVQSKQMKLNNMPLHGDLSDREIALITLWQLDLDELHQKATELLVTEAKSVPRNWICNECGYSSYTTSVSLDDIENEQVSCVNCGGFEFHLEPVK